MPRCTYIDRCTFFQTYGHKRSPAWQGIFATYCQGDLVSYCARWKAYSRGGLEVGPDVMPSGEEVPREFTLLA